MCFGAFVAGRYEEALDALLQVTSPYPARYRRLATTYPYLNRMDEGPRRDGEVSRARATSVDRVLAVPPIVRLMQEYGHGRLQDHPERDSRHDHWREVMEIVQMKRKRKIKRRR